MRVHLPELVLVVVALRALVGPLPAFLLQRLLRSLQVLLLLLQNQLVLLQLPLRLLPLLLLPLLLLQQLLLRLLQLLSLGLQLVTVLLLVLLRLMQLVLQLMLLVLLRKLLRCLRLLYLPGSLQESLCQVSRGCLREDGNRQQSSVNGSSKGPGVKGLTHIDMRLVTTTPMLVMSARHALDSCQRLLRFKNHDSVVRFEHMIAFYARNV
jgi:hypothetical protein